MQMRVFWKLGLDRLRAKPFEGCELLRSGMVYADIRPTGEQANTVKYFLWYQPDIVSLAGDGPPHRPLESLRLECSAAGLLRGSPSKKNVIMASKKSTALLSEGEGSITWAAVGWSKRQVFISTPFFELPPHACRPTG